MQASNNQGHPDRKTLLLQYQQRKKEAYEAKKNKLKNVLSSSSKPSADLKEKTERFQLSVKKKTAEVRRKREEEKKKQAIATTTTPSPPTLMLDLSQKIEEATLIAKLNVNAARDVFENLLLNYEAAKFSAYYWTARAAFEEQYCNSDSVLKVLDTASLYLVDPTSRAVLDRITSDFHKRQSEKSIIQEVDAMLDTPEAQLQRRSSPQSRRLSFTNMAENISSAIKTLSAKKAPPVTNNFTSPTVRLLMEDDDDDERDNTPASLQMMREPEEIMSEDDSFLASPEAVNRVSSPLSLLLGSNNNNTHAITTTTTLPNRPASPTTPRPSPEKSAIADSDINDLCEGASRLVLSTIRTPSKQRKSFGSSTSKVAVPVRRSVRNLSDCKDHPILPDNVVLESTDYAYTPNKALIGSDFKKASRKDTPYKNLVEMTPKMLGDCLLSTVSEKENKVITTSPINTPTTSKLRRSSRRLTQTPTALRSFK